jgi:glutamine amidotransferase
MISVVSYGVCNIGSILNMLRKIGAPSVEVTKPEEIDRAEKLILPGIGSFDKGMTALTQLGLVEPLRNRVRREKVPILGICLGMQLFGKTSDEGELNGLDLIDGRCIRFCSDAGSRFKVPHMGWNELTSLRDNPILEGLSERSRFYFVHSYHLVCQNSLDVLATAHHGVEFTAMVQRENIYGAQFHPEKSHQFGMKLLTNFARL